MLLIWTTSDTLHHQLILEEVINSVAMVIVMVTHTYEGFDWSLHFKWDAFTDQLRAKRVSPIEPIR